MMSSIRDDGTLDYKCFVDELYKFYEIVNRNEEENVVWEMKKFHNEIGGLVLIRKSLINLNFLTQGANTLNYETSNSHDTLKYDALKDENLKDETLNFDNQLEEDNKECKIENQNLISIEHQIVYNISYSVPVLYFKSCFLNGKALTMDEIWKLIPKFCDQFNDLNENQFITMITQFEHPILQKPFYAVHPCKTSEMMINLIKSFDKNQINYILSWLSTIGPISGLNLRLKAI